MTQFFVRLQATQHQLSNHLRQKLQSRLNRLKLQSKQAKASKQAEPKGLTVSTILFPTYFPTTLPTPSLEVVHVFMLCTCEIDVAFG